MINLYDIYKKVSDRHRRLTKKDGVSEVILNLSQAMKSAARAIIDKPILKNVNAFRRAEWNWYTKSPEVSVKANLHADTFETHIRNKDFFIKVPMFNRAKHGWSAKEGIVYCLTCESKPDQVKIGACEEMTLHERLIKLKNRYYKNETFTVEFAYKTNETAELERAVQDSLVAVSGKTKSDSLEWYLAKPSQARKILLKLSKEKGFQASKIRSGGLVQITY